MCHLAHFSGQILTRTGLQCPYIPRMWNFLIGLLLPSLLVFGLYHLLTWVNFMEINSRTFWKRVAQTSVISHALLATGFFVFAYFDYRASRELADAGLGFGTYMFDRSQFWPLMAIFDTLPMALLVGMFLLLDWIGHGLPGLLALTFVITYVAGSVQWYFVGGGIGALLERFWAGLKTSDEDDGDDPDWI